MKKNSALPPNSVSAFTLNELLVVTATCIVLAALALPATSSLKTKTDAAGCLANLHQLQIGWELYRADNNDIMIPSGPLNEPMASESWCGGNEESWNVASGNTNSAMLSASLMGRYVNSNALIFKCPADVVPSVNGQRVRSYSMNGQMGAYYTQLFGGLNYNAPYRTYIYGSDLTCPSPENAFIFIDESPYTMDDGYFQVSSGTPAFPELPASYIEGGGGLSFADGHAVIHMWQTPDVLIPVVPGLTAGGSFNEVAATNSDWLWLTPLTSCLP
jgi:competence protein ComGC